MRYFLLWFIACAFSVELALAQASYLEGKKTYYQPASITMDKLLLGDLPQWRKKVINEALEVSHKNDWLKYKFGGAKPSLGGFDCSGAMYYVLRKSGYQPARTSAGQYLWLKDKGTLNVVPKGVSNLNDPAFAKLMPGDLVFWSGTYVPADGRTVPVTHVGMYLGKMIGYSKPIMICASKGRSYNFKARDGYGIYDFKIPSKTSKSKIVGYGALPQ